MQIKLATLLPIFPILAVATAQTTSPWWSSIPPCALQCAQTAAANAGCNLNDLQCLCNSATFWPDFKNCVQTSCPAVSTAGSPATIFSNACLAIDWTWGESPCIRKCAAKAADVVGCALNDIICLCSHKQAFLDAFYACITNNCPAQFQNALNFIETNFFCPVVDPPPPIGPSN